MAPSRESATPTVLLLARGQAWPYAVRTALGPGSDGVCHLAASAEDAVARLVGPGHPYTHVMVEPALAAGRMADLIGLLFEEPEGGARLVLLGERALGERAGAPPGVPLVREPRAAAIAAVLAVGNPASPASDDRDAGAGASPPPFTDAELRAALARGDVEARFQPIVRVSDRVPIGLEVLARLHDPARGTFAPELFVPQAERAGLSRQLTSAVMATAFGTLSAALLREHGLFLALNLPLDVLLVPEALASLEQQRSGAGFSPSDLLVELTESRPVSDLPGLQAAVERWRHAGYRLAVDDVGPDMPHHLALLGMPFDAMKFAIAVVSDSARNEEAHAYFGGTAALAKRRGLMVIAEGVEDQEDWDRVAALGADAVQGFMVARPLPAGAVPVWLRQWGAALGHGTPGRA